MQDTTSLGSVQYIEQDITKLGATSGNALGSGAVPEDRTSQSTRALSEEEGTQTLSLVPLLIMPLDEGLTQYTRSLQI